MSSVISSLTFYYLEIKDRLGRLSKLQTQPLRLKYVGYFKSSAARASPRSHRLRQRGQSSLATQLRPSSPIVGFVVCVVFVVSFSFVFCLRVFCFCCFLL